MMDCSSTSRWARPSFLFPADQRHQLFLLGIVFEIYHFIQIFVPSPVIGIFKSDYQSEKQYKHAGNTSLVLICPARLMMRVQLWYLSTVHFALAGRYIFSSNLNWTPWWCCNVYSIAMPCWHDDDWSALRYLGTVHLVPIHGVRWS